MGPWKITRVINNDKAYEVELPEDLKRANVTPIFHPWKLHLAPRNPFPGQCPDPQPLVILTNDEEDEHEEWEVLDVVDCRETKRYGVQYKARFMGNWDDWNANPSWQPWTDFTKTLLTRSWTSIGNTQRSPNLQNFFLTLIFFFLREPNLFLEWGGSVRTFALTGTLVLIRISPFAYLYHRTCTLVSFSFP
jgi:hypothetical protein